jgi:hypothetical protein
MSGPRALALGGGAEAGGSVAPGSGVALSKHVLLRPKAAANMLETLERFAGLGLLDGGGGSSEGRSHVGPYGGKARPRTAESRQQRLSAAQLKEHRLRLARGTAVRGSDREDFVEHARNLFSQASPSAEPPGSELARLRARREQLAAMLREAEASPEVPEHVARFLESLSAASVR